MWATLILSKSNRVCRQGKKAFSCYHLGGKWNYFSNCTLLPGNFSLFLFAPPAGFKETLKENGNCQQNSLQSINVVQMITEINFSRVFVIFRVLRIQFLLFWLFQLRSDVHFNSRVIYICLQNFDFNRIIDSSQSIVKLCKFLRGVKIYFYLNRHTNISICMITFECNFNYRMIFATGFCIE